MRSITRRFVIRLSLLIAYFAFLQLGGMGSVGAHEFALKGGANVVKLTLATGEPVRMEMELKPYRPGLLGRPFTRDAWWGSRDGGAPLPDKVIWSMRLSVNGKPAVLPQSAFDYLTNCNALDLHEDHGGITAILSGGDAGEGYNVEWRFTYSKVLACYVLRSRRVHYGEFPEVHENTDYTYNENKDL